MTKASGSATREKQDGTAPVVTVIIPAYNAAKYIRCAVGSVLAQTFQDREIIVINDGSPDTAETERELGDYMEEIIYIKQENGGPAAARNLGRSEEHTSELQSRFDLVCRLLLEKKK